MSIAAKCVCERLTTFCDGGEGCRYAMKNNPQEVSQVKSVDEHAEEVWDKHSEYIDDDIHSLDSVAGSSVIPSRYKFLKAAQDIAKPLVDRIAELESELKSVQPFVESLEMKVIRLEAENAKLREALELMLELNPPSIEDSIHKLDAIHKGRQALNSKEG